MTRKSGLADSPFFKPAGATSATEANTRTPVRTPEHVNTRTGVRASVRTGDRKIIRHSFNIYQDQLEALRRCTARKTLEGGQMNLSDLVRKALDDILSREA